MEMALPHGTPTLEHMRTKRYSRPDNVFCTQLLKDHVISCEVNSKLRPLATDHFPILTTISLPQARITEPPSYDFRNADWDDFRENLASRLEEVPEPAPITSERQLHEVLKGITSALQDTIRTRIKIRRPRPDSKRWWNSDLKKMKKELNKLRTESFKLRTLTHHPIHDQRRLKSNQYGEEILRAKQQHWTDYLEELSANEIWTANKYIKEPIGDGGSPRIPTLKVKDNNGREIEVNENMDKATHFVKSFFPPPPTTTSIPKEYIYPQPLPDPPEITTDQIKQQVQKLAPYKAPGPDEIPNIVIIKCFDLIAEYLTYIIQAILGKGIYFDPWREFTTVVLRKPGKPNYQLPKAYRPIALICTLAKLVTAIVASDISHLVETHKLLPNTHFGGRPGRTTTDALHYLTHRIKKAWRKGKVASVLFLDVEGAFPNAVTNRLTHNLRKRRIPDTYVKFVNNILRDRRTKLKFDDYTSEAVEIHNGIGQGDPLSMILYIIYNADILEIIGNEEKEDALGYVDDVALIAIGRTFEETTRKLEHMMVKEGGGLEWSREHNSLFEISKSAVLHASRRTQPSQEDENKRVPLDRPPLLINGTQIREVENFKYLGILIDAQLRWNAQSQKAISNATKWLLQFRRLTSPTTGVKAKLIALPLSRSPQDDIWTGRMVHPANQANRSDEKPRFGNSPEGATKGTADSLPGNH